MKIIKFNILLLILFGSLISNAQSNIREVNGFQNPESVIPYKKHLLVSNLGVKLDPTAKDGDGYITMISRGNGTIEELKFISGLNSPKGMFVKFGILHIADADKVVAYHLKSKKKIWEADLSKQGVTYANDLAKGCFKLYVSATDRDSIYKVKITGKVKTIRAKAALPGANGLRKGCGKLFVANYGRGLEPNGGFGKLNLCSRKYTAYQKTGSYDGILKCRGYIYATDWVSASENMGRLVSYKISKKTLQVIDIGKTMNGPADMCYDKKSKGIWIPVMRENKIVFIPRDKLK